MKNTFQKFLMASASFAFVSPLVMATPSLAQSTATQQIESVTVSANASGTGVMVPIIVPKERATIDQDFINTQPAGQSIFESLNLVPGYNFTNADPYGNSGGNVRIHGFDGNRISFTWDGMPLNDTGNYAIFTNQVADSEIISTATVNQGSTDVDSPTASAVGGVIAIQTTRPKEEFSALSDTSFGSYNEVREFARVDSGTFGPWGTRAFASYSYSYYDKWKGPGYLQKRQYNGELYQDLGATGWISLAVHYNENRNNFYNSVTFLPSNANTQYIANAATVGGATPLSAAQSAAAGLPTLGVGAPNVAYNTNGSYVGVGTPPLPTTATGYGLTWDEASLCTRPAAVAGTAQVEAT
ncbi:MAG TPA: TonB-dependent receptor, partial [Rhizomicrobium sp.]|nr:TonB-dependent receptor [Rhizomicrobium sp.]